MLDPLLTTQAKDQASVEAKAKERQRVRLATRVFLGRRRKRAAQLKEASRRQLLEALVPKAKAYARKKAGGGKGR